MAASKLDAYSWEWLAKSQGKGYKPGGGNFWSDKEGVFKAKALESILGG